MNLNFSVTGASDNSYVVIQDTTPDWGAGEIADVFNNGDANLTIAILGITYDAISVKSYFENGLQAELAFIIRPEDLLIGGIQQFSGDSVPDGDWNITYVASHTIGGAVIDTDSQRHLIYGTVEKAVLEMLRITQVFPLTFEETLRKAMIRLAHYSYLQGIINSAYSSEIDNLRVALTDLQTMINNGEY